MREASYASAPHCGPGYGCAAGRHFARVPRPLTFTTRLAAGQCAGPGAIRAPPRSLTQAPLLPIPAAAGSLCTRRLLLGLTARSAAPGSSAARLRRLVRLAEHYRLATSRNVRIAAFRLGGSTN